MSVESGQVANKKVTEYKVKDENGKIHSERVEYDKDKKEVIRRTLNGKEVEKVKKEEEKEVNPVPYIPDSKGNGELFIINRLDMLFSSLKLILNQLTEMNYYICKAYGDETDIERINKLINNG